MQTKVGWIVTILGALCAVAGLTIMIVLGPDSRFTTGPHEIDTDGIAVVTAPSVISWKGVQVDVLAEVPVNKPVFVGIGNSVDVQNYVKDTRRLEVTSLSTPWNVRIREVEGREGLSGAPTALDWWIAGSAGLGGARVSTLLPDQTVSAAILSVGSSNLQGLKVSYAYGIKGGFAKGVGLVLLGIGGVWGGALIRRGEGYWDEEEDEETVFVRRRAIPDEELRGARGSGGGRLPLRRRERRRAPDLSRGGGGLRGRRGGRRGRGGAGRGRGCRGRDRRRARAGTRARAATSSGHLGGAHRGGHPGRGRQQLGA